jgi:hypothetical protein
MAQHMSAHHSTNELRPLLLGLSIEQQEVVTTEVEPATNDLLWFGRRPRVPRSKDIKNANAAATPKRYCKQIEVQEAGRVMEGMQPLSVPSGLPIYLIISTCAR